MIEFRKLWVPVHDSGSVWAALAHPNRTIVEKRVQEYKNPEELPEWKVLRATLTVDEAQP